MSKNVDEWKAKRTDEPKTKQTERTERTDEPNAKQNKRNSGVSIGPSLRGSKNMKTIKS